MNEFTYVGLARRAPVISPRNSLRVPASHAPLLLPGPTPTRQPHTHHLATKPRRLTARSHERDPLGLHNLATAPGHPASVAAIRTPLDTLPARTIDRGALPDPTTGPTFATIQKNKRRDYRQAWTTRLQKPEAAGAGRPTWWEQAYRFASAAPTAL